MLGCTLNSKGVNASYIGIPIYHVDRHTTHVGLIDRSN